jgi:hypothetical protein
MSPASAGLFFLCGQTTMARTEVTGYGIGGFTIDAASARLRHID